VNGEVKDDIKGLAGNASETVMLRRTAVAEIGL
jgi:hypothetical protein